ncbi:MAG: hypothetical protein HYV07_02595 [Deltaproteobacteria bacterium]|nr:hypothetical protein [Deltaproteobacteria bacterium]
MKVSANTLVGVVAAETPSSAAPPRVQQLGGGGAEYRRGLHFGYASLHQPLVGAAASEIASVRPIPTLDRATAKREMRQMRALLPTAAFVLGLPASAAAGGNDFRLNATLPNGEGIFFQTDTGSVFTPRTEAWTAFANELGSVIAPRIASPAETLGHGGFALGLLWSGSMVSSSADYWKATSVGQSTGQPRGLLQTLQLEVRKGLPLSFEIGLDLVWLADSQMFAPGVEVRWAPVEGYRFVPDLAVRGSASHLVGSRDVNLTVVGIDAVISKSFGVGGFVNIAPYGSFSIVMVAATPRVIDPTPTDEGDVGKNMVLPSLSAGDNANGKLTIGSRFLFSMLNLSLQSEFMLLDSPLVTISTKLGLEF